jgi:hypothetical protein
MEKGSQYVQFMPCNSACDPGPMYGPAEEIFVQMVGYYTEDGKTIVYQPAFRVGSRTFVFKEGRWTIYTRNDGKDVYTPVANNENGGNGGYERFRVVSLKTVIDDAEERVEREARFAKLLAQRKKANRKK